MIATEINRTIANDDFKYCLISESIDVISLVNIKLYLEVKKLAFKLNFVLTFLSQIGKFMDLVVCRPNMHPNFLQIWHSQIIISIIIQKMV